MAIEIEWHEVQSSNIAAIGAGKNNEGGKLLVRFNSGSIYAYSDVPADVIQDFLDASSKGKYFAEHIKEKYEYEKVS